MPSYSSRLITAGGVACLLALACSDDGVGPIVPLISCQPIAGGDFLTRGLYVDSFPGSRLREVRMFFSGTVVGNYTISLTVRRNAYDGPLVGADTITINVPTTASDTVPGSFLFANPVIQAGSIVTFQLGQVSGPGTLFYATPANPGCPATETEGTTPPLDTFRREGMGLRIFGPR